METGFEQMLINSYKEELVSFLKMHPENFEEVIKLAISDKQPYSWRAAWLLWSCMDNNDRRVTSYVDKIVEVLPLCNDSQARELLIILQKMQVNEESEGKLFDICINIWEKTEKKPSTRYNAFKMMIRIAKKHPEFIKELSFLVEAQYLNSLSKTVKKSIYQLLKFTI